MRRLAATLYATLAVILILVASLATFWALFCGMYVARQPNSYPPEAIGRWRASAIVLVVVLALAAIVARRVRRTRGLLIAFAAGSVVVGMAAVTMVQFATSPIKLHDSDITNDLPGGAVVLAHRKESIDTGGTVELVNDVETMELVIGLRDDRAGAIDRFTHELRRRGWRLGTTPGDREGVTPSGDIAVVLSPSDRQASDDQLLDYGWHAEEWHSTIERESDADVVVVVTAPFHHS